MEQCFNYPHILFPEVYMPELLYVFIFFSVETHYIRNRQERGTARVDTKAAKTAYLEEVKRAGLLREVELQRL